MAEMIPTGPDKDETGHRVEAAIHSQLDAIGKRYEDSILQGVADIIARYDTPDRSSLPEHYEKAAPHRGVIETASPTAWMYRRMHSEERAWRSPDADHWYREFIAGVFQNDGARQTQARAKLDSLFPNARATTLEGAADASGGFAAGTGGVLLPRPLENLVAIARDRLAKMWRFASRYDMVTQEHNIPTGAAMTAFMVGEATSPVTQGEPALAQVPLIAHRGAAKAILGNDLLEDAAVNVVNFFTTRGGASLAVLEDNEFFAAGTGSAPHVTKLSGTAFATTTTGTLSYTDVVAMYAALPQVYRSNAMWFMAADVLGFMANVRDGMGRPFYQSLLDPPMALTDDADAGPMAGAQGTLLGRPVHEVPLTPGDIWFGDPNACYAVGRRQGIRVDVSREFYRDTFRTLMLVHQRFAGNNVDTAAAQYETAVTAATSL
ncbi:MAG TPA: phage major capsid protein [Candidatus Krumholzibacteria bacterium]